MGDYSTALQQERQKTSSVSEHDVLCAQSFFALGVAQTVQNIWNYLNFCHCSGKKVKNKWEFRWETDLLYNELGINVWNIQSYKQDLSFAFVSFFLV